MLESMSDFETDRALARIRSSRPGSRIGLASAVTLSRLFAAPLLAAAIVAGEPLAAGLLFGFAVATDALDGRIARRRNEVSAAGGLFDHATDATFVVTGLLTLSWIGTVPPILPLLIACAFLQYLFDSRAHRGKRLRASRLGRWNGIAYFVVLGTPLIRDAIGLAWPGPTLVRAIAFAVAATTLLSMFDRLRVASRETS